MREEIVLSMQKAPEEGFVRLFAFDLNPNTREMNLAHMQRFPKEEYEESIKLLKHYLEELDALGEKDGGLEA